MTNKPKIQRKPKRSTATNSDIDAFLGGNATSKEIQVEPLKKSVNKSKKGRPKGTIPKGNFRQSVPTIILDKLNKYLENLENPPSRNAWIVQAIIEKLDRDI